MRHTFISLLVILTIGTAGFYVFYRGATLPPAVPGSHICMLVGGVMLMAASIALIYLIIEVKRQITAALEARSSIIPTVIGFVVSGLFVLAVVGKFAMSVGEAGKLEKAEQAMHQAEVIQARERALRTVVQDALSKVAEEEVKQVAIKIARIKAAERAATQPSTQPASASSLAGQ